MKIRLSAPMTRDSIVDGPGLRSVIWTQGCFHHCPGCHNPCTHNPFGGFEMDTADLIAQLSTLKLQRGITLSGGEPFLQPLPLAEIAQAAAALGLDVWVFSGFTFEQLTDRRNREWENRMALLRRCDVLVDGRFVREKRDLSLRFRGSSNQRIVDVKKSLDAAAPIVIDEYMGQAV
ncbi:MAG: anaerobic ribonucleoside-triphosphate reductase activating protein [Pyramidobacter sp.]|jgi:anaerobic ribonucleoside-triphosphate reductase activating protein